VFKKHARLTDPAGAGIFLYANINVKGVFVDGNHGTAFFFRSTGTMDPPGEAHRLHGRTGRLAKGRAFPEGSRRTERRGSQLSCRELVELGKLGYKLVYKPQEHPGTIVINTIL